MEDTTLRHLAVPLDDIVQPAQLLMAMEDVFSLRRPASQRYALAAERAPVLFNLIGSIAKYRNVLPSSIAWHCPLPDRIALLGYAHELQRTRQCGFRYL